MSARFEELDWRPTPMGAISLRRRRDPGLGLDVYEVKLGDEFLMSSLFTVAEVELAQLALARTPGDRLDVLVGGLGLGYTARAVLQDPRVRSLAVVEALPEVIGWHERGLLPHAVDLTSDPRCRLVRDDFFRLVSDPSHRPDAPRWHAVVVDIDHSPRQVLHPSHETFYTEDGLRTVGSRLHPGGVFALWSDEPPDPDFQAVLARVFDAPEAHVVSFPNPYTAGESANTVYTGSAAG